MNYKNKVWDEIEGFDAFSIHVPREEKHKLDCSDVSNSLLIPHPTFEKDVYLIDLVYRPSVLDNDQSWQVFDDDKHIISFLEGSGTFSNLVFEGSQDLEKSKTIEQP